MNLLNVLVIYIVPFVVGVLSWFLALKRVQYCIQKKTRLLCCTVFMEEILSIAVIYLLLINQNLIGMCLYAVGGSLGAYLVVPKEDSEKKPSE